MPPIEDEELAFDRVAIVIGGTRRLLPVEQFLSLPLDQRIRHIMARELEFYLGEKSVERSFALSSLRRRQTQRP